MLRSQMDDEPYRLVVSIIRGTNAGRALSMMANGIRIVAATREEAAELLDKYVDAAAAVLDGISEGICMGMVSILNTHTSKVEESTVLTGTDKTTTLGAHKAS